MNDAHYRNVMMDEERINPVIGIDEMLVPVIDMLQLQGDTVVEDVSHGLPLFCNSADLGKKPFRPLASPGPLAHLATLGARTDQLQRGLSKRFALRVGVGSLGD